MPVDLSKLTDEQLEAYRSLRSGAPQEQKPAYAPQAPQTVGHAAGEALSAINPLPALWSMLRHPVDTVKGLVSAQGEQLGKVPGLVRQGRYSEALGHGMAGALPLVGPTAARIADQIGGEEPEFDKYGNVVKQGQEPDLAGGISRAAATIGNIAAAPALTRAIGTTVKAAPRPLVRTALRIPSKAEAFDANPAQMALEHTRGVRPATIAGSAQDSMNTARTNMEGLVSRSTSPVDLTPARALVSDAQSTAARQGNKLVNGQIEPMREALQGNRVTGNPYPSSVAPSEALDLKRGFGDEFVNYNNPDIHTRVNALGKDVYGNLREQIHAAAPGSEALDDIVHGLIPVKNAALKTARDPTLGQRILTRIARPTGGLVPAMIGLKAGGPLGAATALTAAEAAASPVPLMVVARGMFGLGKAIGSPLSQRGAQITPFMRRPEQ